MTVGKLSAAAAETHGFRRIRGWGRCEVTAPGSLLCSAAPSLLSAADILRTAADWPSGRYPLTLNQLGAERRSRPPERDTIRPGRRVTTTQLRPSCSTRTNARVTGEDFERSATTRCPIGH